MEQLMSVGESLASLYIARDGVAVAETKFAKQQAV
jgi:hypothetical protein